MNKCLNIITTNAYYMYGDSLPRVLQFIVFFCSVCFFVYFSSMYVCMYVCVLHLCVYTLLVAHYVCCWLLIP